MLSHTLLTLALAALTATTHASPEPLPEDVHIAIVAASENLASLTDRQADEYASLAALVAGTHANKRQDAASADDLNAILAVSVPSKQSFEFEVDFKTEGVTAWFGDCTDMNRQMQRTTPTTLILTQTLSLHLQRATKHMPRRRDNRRVIWMLFWP